MRTLKELGRSYLTITQDLTRVMSRIKTLYRSWASPCSGTTVYAPRHRAEWLAKIVESGVRVRAQRLYLQLDLLQPVRQQARQDLLRESHKHQAVKLLRQIPAIGPIRAALLVALHSSGLRKVITRGASNQVGDSSWQVTTKGFDFFPATENLANPT